MIYVPYIAQNDSTMLHKSASRATNSAEHSNATKDWPTCFNSLTKRFNNRFKLIIPHGLVLRVLCGYILFCFVSTRHKHALFVYVTVLNFSETNRGGKDQILYACDMCILQSMDAY